MRKKLFAILMSAMMMVTFMPAMAFAGAEDTVTVNFAGDNYSQLVATYGGETATVDTVRDFYTVDGATAVYVTKAALDNYFAEHQFVNATKLRQAMDEYQFTPSGTKWIALYDFTGATLKTPVEILRENASNFITTDNTLESAYRGIKLKQPSYATYVNGSADTTTAQEESGYVSSFNGWNPTYKVTGYDAKTLTAQTATIKVNFTTNSATNRYLLKGSVEQTMLVKAIYAVKENAFFTIDGDVNTTYHPNEGDTVNITKTYDGNVHSIAIFPLDGVTVSYSKFNNTTGAFDAVDAISFKSANDDALFKAEIKDSKSTTAKKTVYFNVAVKRAYVSLGLDKDASNKIKKTVYIGENYDAYDLVAFNALTGIADCKDNTEKAIAADAAALKAFVKAYYDVTATPDKYDATKVAVKFALKKAVDTKAMQAEAVCLDFNFKNMTTVDDSAVLTLVKGDKANEIEFVNAPSKKTFKAKKLKKAAKSFTVKAEALSGVAPSYKLINANSKIKIDRVSGKITLKKGLKKGTYKITVKAYGCAGNGYVATSETQSITVKVTK